MITTRRLTLAVSLLAVFILASFPAFGQVEEAPTRDQIEDKYKWDLTDFFESDEAYEEAMAKAGNTRDAAKLMGINHSTVVRKAQRYGINLQNAASVDVLDKPQ